MIRLFKVFVPTSVVALLLSEMILISGSYILASFILYRRYDYDPVVFLLDEGGLVSIGIVTLVILLGFYFHDLYTEFRVHKRILLVQQICSTIGAAFIFQAGLVYFNRGWMLPQRVMVEGSTFVFIVLFSWRLLYSTTIWKAVGLQRILFLGSSPLVVAVANHLETNPQFGVLPVGYLDEEPGSENGTTLPGCGLKRLGGFADLSTAVQSAQPTRIIVGMKERRRKLPVNELLQWRFAGIQTEEIASLYETIFSRVCAREILPSQLIFSTEFGPRAYSLRFQKLYSATLASLGLLIALPIMLLVAVLVKLTSPGPILFRQSRVGLHNKTFTIYKFRSMRRDAERDTGAVWAQRNDPRITPLGYWLRRLRLDELPQLINVVRGEMSIVGPRPERPEFVTTLSEQIPYYLQRHSVMPGITGLAQINHKYSDTIEDTITKLEYDLYYVKHISFSLDLYIMFHTAKTMLLFRGAQ